jgi:hypothetical protein
VNGLWPLGRVEFPDLDLRILPLKDNVLFTVVPELELASADVGRLVLEDGLPFRLRPIGRPGIGHVEDERAARLEVAERRAQAGQLVLDRLAVSKSVESTEDAAEAPAHRELPHVGHLGPHAEARRPRLVLQAPDHGRARVEAFDVDAGPADRKEDPARAAGDLEHRASGRLSGLEPIRDVEIERIEQKVIEFGGLIRGRMTDIVHDDSLRPS